MMEAVLPATSLISYARENGLTLDSEQHPAQTFPGFSTSIDNLMGLAADLETTLDDSHLSKLVLPPTEHLDTGLEGLVVSSAAIDVADLALTLGRDLCPVVLPGGPGSLPTLKLELPLLSSDHEHDVQQLLQECRARCEPVLVAGILPSERLDASADEGMAFPAEAETLRIQLNTELRDERLDVSRKTMEWLGDALRCCLPDSQELKDGGQIHQRRQFISRLSMTPPMLSPVSDGRPFVPEFEICQVPLTSDPDTLIEEDLAEVTKDVMQQDKLQSDSSPNVCKQFLNFSSPSDHYLMRSENHNPIHMEGPLSPRYEPVTNPLICKSWDEYAKDIMAIFPPYTVSHSKPEEPPHNDDMLTTYGHETIEKFYQGLHQERLDAADATARIPISPMDFKHNPPDWHALGLSSQAQLASLLKQYECVLKQPALSHHGYSDSQLRWIPFPATLARLDLQECIEHTDAIQQFLNNTTPDSPIMSADCTQYESGSVNLRRQYADQDEEELMSSLSIPIARGEDGLSKPRSKKRVSSPKTTEILHNGGSSAHDPRDTHNRSRTDASQNDPHSALIIDTISTMLPDSMSKSATSTLLSNFIDMHAYKKRKLTSSSFFAKPDMANSTSQKVKPGDRRVPSEVAPNQPAVTPPIMTIPTFVPLIKEPQPAARLIKSLTLDRAVFSRLEVHYPKLSIVERDFDRWNTATWDKGVIIRSPKVSPLSMEADLIISPATGLIVTSLVKVMQKSSSTNQEGSIKDSRGSNNSLQSKVTNITSRYERLIILISERNAIDESARVLSTAETEAIAEFNGFATALPTQVEVRYVGGGVDTLARWITFMIIKYTSPGVNDKIVQDESSWEIFLRRAGMNAYAAQVIPGLAQMAVSSTTIPPEHGSAQGNCKNSFWEAGLAAFMRMTPVQRVKNFRDILGGDHVLNNVSKILEARWA